MLEKTYVCPLCGLERNAEQLNLINTPLTVTVTDYNTGVESEEFKIKTPQTIKELSWRICTQCNTEVIYQEKKQWRDQKMPELDIAQYLNGEEVKELEKKGPVEIEITGEGEYSTINDKITKQPKINQSTGKEEKMFNLPVQIVGLPVENGSRIWSPNKTTQIKIVGKYGRNTGAWVGKKIALKTALQNVSGQMKNVVYGEPA